MSFELIGHECPMAEYPAPVVPIGTLEGRRVVSFRDQDNVIFEPVAEGAQFIEHSPELRRRLQDYDVRTHGLFAFGEQDVVAYRIEDERTFFDGLLSHPKTADRALSDPFFRLSLAAVTGFCDAVLSELVASTRAMAEEAPEFLEGWYETARTELQRSGFSPDHWPADPGVLLERTPARLPPSARRILADIGAARSATRQSIGRLREAVQKSKGNGRVERLAELMGVQSESDVRVLFTGARRSSVRAVLSGLLEGDVGDLLSDVPDEQPVWITFGESVSREAAYSGSGERSFELRLPAQLCALGFRFLETGPPTAGTADDDGSPNQLPQADLFVYVVDGFDHSDSMRFNLILQEGPRATVVLASRAGEARATAADQMLEVASLMSTRTLIMRESRVDRPDDIPGSFGRAVSGVTGLEELLANQALELIQTPHLRSRLEDSIGIGTEHSAFLRDRLGRSEAVQGQSKQRVAYLRKESGAVEERFQEFLLTCQRELEPAFRQDFRRFIGLCKDIAVSAVQRWRFPSQSYWILLPIRQSEYEQSVMVLMRHLEQELGRAISNFRAAPWTDRDYHPNLSARMPALFDRLATVRSERRSLQYDSDSLNIIVKRTWGAAAGSEPFNRPALGLLPGVFSTPAAGMVNPSFGPIALRSYVEAQTRSFLLYGTERSKGLLAIIDDWALRVEEDVSGRLAGWLREFGRPVLQELQWEEGQLRLARQREESERLLRESVLHTALAECEACVESLRKILASLAPGRQSQPPALLQ